ncbi:MAG: lipid-A-disaccharide synthase [Bacteroidales bacterium]|nr:lipid-A-disaccharide synthase [Bacteroidales bacterium]
MKYYLIAGEASGDMHGANLIKALGQRDPESEFRFLGGNKMKNTAGTLSVHYKETAVMGGWEILTSLGKISRNFKRVKKDILEYKPDALILIDYAGFNLRIAKFAKENGFRVFYYISPKVWAWNRARVKKIKQYVDKMYCILPFEVDFYKKYGYTAEYIGNPILDALQDKKTGTVSLKKFINKNKLSDKPIIALLAGSRKQEIELCLPEMLAIIKNFKDYQFVIAGVDFLPKELYQKFLTGSDVLIVYDQTYALLQNAVAAVVTSGTATLETALLKIPEIVIYKTSAFNYHIGKHLVRIKYFSLVNLIMDKEVVKEFFQENLAAKISDELSNILFNTGYRQQMLENYNLLEGKVGEPGASERVAEKIYSTLTN